MLKKALPFLILAMILDHPLALAQSAVPGEFIVQLRPESRINQLRQLSGPGSTWLGGTVSQVLSHELGLVLVERPSLETEELSLSTLANDDSVVMVEPNYIFKISEDQSNAPNDPLFVSQWALSNTGQETSGEGGIIPAKAGVDIGAPMAWSVTTFARNILIGVIDTGVDDSNLDLIRALRVNNVERNGQPGVDDDGNGCVDDFYGCNFISKNGDTKDDNGHGTHITGLIGAGGNNQTGIAGIVWNAQILTIKAFDQRGFSNEAALISAMEYARTMKVKIINASWGSPSYGQALREVFRLAEAEGILVVAAAGNAGTDIEFNPEFPASYDFENILTVASVDPDGSFTNTSNFGQTSVDLAAPGNNILSYGLNGLESKKGTSMAVPFVTGVAALLWAQDTRQSYGTVRSRLLAGVRPMGMLRTRTASGGLLNAGYALRNMTAPIDHTDPYLWQRQNQSISSGHPYESSVDRVWKFTVPGASQVVVHFSSFETETRFDFVEIIDGSGTVVTTLSGKLGERYSPVVSGDTVSVHFKTDSSLSRPGWDIDHIAFQ